MLRKKAKRKLNTRLIKSTELYLVGELAKTLDVCSNTISNMISEGLPIVEGSYPYIIRGELAIIFIRERLAKSKIKLKQDELYCLPCRKPYRPKNGMVTLHITAPKRGNLKSPCNTCDRTTNRGIALEDVPKFEKVLKIQKVLNPLLIEGFNSSGICETKEVRKND